MTYETIIVEKSDGVATVTLNRPERLNALNPKMGEELRVAVKQLTDDKEARVIVITGAGRGFCAGADLAPGVWQLSTTPVDVTETTRSSGLTKALRTMMKPVIASVNGPAVGGGMNLALACDMIIASETAKFGLTFIKVRCLDIRANGDASEWCT